MKIYTKTGDKGETGLLGGQRVSKDHIRIDSYGTVDELNSQIGLLIAQLDNYSFKESGEIDDLMEDLTEIQSRLFDIGSHLASEDKDLPYLPKLSEEIVSKLEVSIDTMDEDLNPLKSFILPGGSLAIATAHVCRTICRRAERRVVQLNNIDKGYEFVIIYLNRLSDYLFVLCRWIGYHQKIKEVPWVPSK